jgi:hypothetical protein
MGNLALSDAAPAPCLCGHDAAQHPNSLCPDFPQCWFLLALLGRTTKNFPGKFFSLNLRGSHYSSITQTATLRVTYALGTVGYFLSQ